MRDVDGSPHDAACANTGSHGTASNSSPSREITKLSQNAVTGRGAPPPGPSPEWRYPVGSRFTLLDQDKAQMADNWEVRAPIRLYRRFGDLFGMTSRPTPESAGQASSRSSWSSRPRPPRSAGLAGVCGTPGIARKRVRREGVVPRPRCSAGRAFQQPGSRAGSR